MAFQVIIFLHWKWNTLSIQEVVAQGVQLQGMPYSSSSQTCSFQDYIPHVTHLPRNYYMSAIVSQNIAEDSGAHARRCISTEHHHLQPGEWNVSVKRNLKMYCFYSHPLDRILRHGMKVEAHSKCLCNIPLLPSTVGSGSVCCGCFFWTRPLLANLPASSWQEIRGMALPKLCGMDSLLFVHLCVYRSFSKPCLV